MTGEICAACHVRLRPHVTQQIRRNDDIVQCENCQRILFFAETDVVKTVSSPTVNIDGGARGNPGPAGWGAVVTDADGDTGRRALGALPHATNNVAEYQGLLAALDWCATHGATDVHVRSDSLLLVQQMKGVYKVKNEGLKPLYGRARLLATAIGRVTFEHVRRELNSDADRLAESRDGRSSPDAARGPDAGRLMSDRKYRQRGYQDERPREPARRTGPRKPPEPRDPRMPRDPRVPNMPGFRDVFRCTRCGHIEPRDVGSASTCGKCGVDLHACVQCASFDAGARFECMQPIPARVSPKDVRNACTFFAPRVRVERETGSTPAPGSGAKKAFDDLFKF